MHDSKAKGVYSYSLNNPNKVEVIPVHINQEEDVTAMVFLPSKNTLIFHQKDQSVWAKNMQSGKQIFKTNIDFDEFEKPEHSILALNSKKTDLILMADINKIVVLKSPSVNGYDNKIEINSPKEQGNEISMFRPSGENSVYVLKSNFRLESYEYDDYKASLKHVVEFRSGSMVGDLQSHVFNVCPNNRFLVVSSHDEDRSCKDRLFLFEVGMDGNPHEKNCVIFDVNLDFCYEGKKLVLAYELGGDHLIKAYLIEGNRLKLIESRGMKTIGFKVARSGDKLWKAGLNGKIVKMELGNGAIRDKAMTMQRPQKREIDNFPINGGSQGSDMDYSHSGPRGGEKGIRPSQVDVPPYGQNPASTAGTRMLPPRPPTQYTPSKIESQYNRGSASSSAQPLRDTNFSRGSQASGATRGNPGSGQALHLQESTFRPPLTPQNTVPSSVSSNRVQPFNNGTNHSRTAPAAKDFGVSPLATHQGSKMGSKKGSLRGSKHSRIPSRTNEPNHPSLTSKNILGHDNDTSQFQSPSKYSSSFKKKRTRKKAERYPVFIQKELKLKKVMKDISIQASDGLPDQRNNNMYDSTKFIVNPEEEPYYDSSSQNYLQQASPTKGKTSDEQQLSAYQTRRRGHEYLKYHSYEPNFIGWQNQPELSPEKHSSMQDPDRTVRMRESLNGPVVVLDDYQLNPLNSFDSAMDSAATVRPAPRPAPFPGPVSGPAAGSGGMGRPSGSGGRRLSFGDDTARMREMELSGHTLANSPVRGLRGTDYVDLIKAVKTPRVQKTPFEMCK